jgi:hypothetical protein
MTNTERAAQLAQMREVQRKRLVELDRKQREQAARDCVEKWAKLQNEKLGRTIDSAYKLPAQHFERVVTKELERSRLTLHDHAQHNPVLARVLRQLQKVGTL